VPNGDTVAAYIWENIKHSHQDVMERKETLIKDLVTKIQSCKVECASNCQWGKPESLRSMSGQRTDLTITWD